MSHFLAVLNGQLHVLLAYPRVYGGDESRRGALQEADNYFLGSYGLRSQSLPSMSPNRVFVFRALHGGFIIYWC